MSQNPKTTLLDDSATSHWLKHALKAALERDPVDAANDAELLAEILAERADTINIGNSLK